MTLISPLYNETINTQQVTICQEQRTLKSSVKLFLSFNETSQTFILKIKFLGKMFLMKNERLENVKLGAVGICSDPVVVRGVKANGE